MTASPSRRRRGPAVVQAASAALLSAAPAATQSGPGACTPALVDHVPVAVHSLEQARDTFQRLGFRLKPGRAHANGLRNAFAKLPDGSYLELISPEGGPLDDLAAAYIEVLEHGEGGAFLALRASPLERQVERLRSSELEVRPGGGGAFNTLSFAAPELRWLFLIEYGTPVVDPPGLLDHPNTSEGIHTVWVRSRPWAALEPVRGSLCMPGVEPVPGPPARTPVTGVTIRVRTLARTAEHLRAAGFTADAGADERGATLRVQAHGLWIEFLEPAPPR